MYKTFFNIIKFRRMKKSATKEDLFTANKSPLNTSKSKAMFKFTQGERFPNLTSKDTYHFYEKTSMLDKRSPSFGYGNKTDIALKSFSPSPDKYNLQSDFEKSPKKGVSMGKSRDDCKSISIFYQTHNPPPGTYNIFQQNSKNLTMSPKLKFPSLWNESMAPGPGQYDFNKVDNQGMCLLSKYKSKNGFKIHPKSPEKQNKVAALLGPGTYDTNLSANGKQVLARNRTEKSFVFSKKNRETLNQKTISPGPGAYTHYSIFGLS